MDTKYKTHIMSDKTIVLVFNDKTVPISKNNSEFENIKKALTEYRYGALPMLADKATRISHQTKGEFKVKNGVVCYQDEALPEALSKRLMEFIEKKLPCTALRNFWKNLKENPSQDSRNELYLFLENQGIPITEDGYLIAYKYVNEDFMDCHTRTFDNSVGKVVEIPRDQVDPNRNNACSYGLHVGAFKYVVGNGQHIVEVKVNPKDVVSVPVDHNCMKMRVARYEVLAELHTEIGDKPVESPLHSMRTYYYRGTHKKNQKFRDNLVSSKKPGRVLKTIRASNKKQAIALLKKVLKIND